MSEQRTCPLCGSPMKMRSSRYGPFYGCTKYPGCRGTRQIDEEVDEEVKGKSIAQQNAEWERMNELDLNED